MAEGVWSLFLRDEVLASYVKLNYRSNDFKNILKTLNLKKIAATGYESDSKSYTI